MPTASYVKVTSANEDLAEGINCGTDQWAIALTNTVPGSKVFTSGTTDLATSGGYTAGGANVSTSSSSMNASDSVSYTHLRAHETVLDLVCRLLLEKKKNRKPNTTYIVHVTYNQTLITHDQVLEIICKNT